MKETLLKNRLLSTLCFMLASYSITFSQSADAGEDKVTCPDGEVTIGGKGNSSWCYSWKPDTGLSDPHILNPKAKPGTTTTYTLTVTGPNFEFSSTDQMTVKVEPPEVELKVENNITECMERRTITYTAEAKKGFQASPDNPIKFTFHYEKADGTAWTHEEWSFDLTQDHTVMSDEVPNGDADHKFKTPIYVEAEQEKCKVKSKTLDIEVYELWIEFFRDRATGKAWKVVVGEDIEYKAIASKDCKDWVWDMEDGFFDAWNPNKGNKRSTAEGGAPMKIPYGNLSGKDGDDFGDAYGTVNVSCKDEEGNSHQIYSTSLSPSMKVKVFFDPALNVDGVAPTSASKPPCWYLFWRDGAVPGLDEFEYKHFNSYGESQVQNGFFWDSHILRVGIPAGGTHYPGGLLVNGIQFGGATGIDCCAEVVVHEKHHNILAVEINGGAADTDPATVAAPGIGDYLPDVREAALGCSKTNKDTHNLTAIKSPVYASYGDNEYSAMSAAKGAKGVVNKDWSKGGKQW